MNRGAIILCGGRSSRMGRDKALLPFGPQETLLQRVVRIVSEVVPADEIVCVAAVDQELPTLRDGVRIVRDTVLDQGPLAALATGLTALRGEVDAVCACGCDSPLITSTLIEQLFKLLGGQRAAAPCEAAFVHPLPAAYSVDVVSIAQSLLDRGEMSLRALLAACDSRQIDVSELRDIDPDLNFLVNCNSPAEYAAAMAWAFPGAIEA